MRIEGESPALSAATIGGMIANTRKLLLAVAKENGERVEVMVESIQYGRDDKAMEITFLVLRVKA